MTRLGQRILSSLNSLGKFLEWLTSQLPESVTLALGVLVAGLGVLGFLIFLGTKSSDQYASHQPQYHHYQSYEIEHYQQSHKHVPQQPINTPTPQAHHYSQPRVQQAVPSAPPIYPGHAITHTDGNPSYWYRHSERVRARDSRFGNPRHSLSQSASWQNSGAAQAAY